MLLAAALSVAGCGGGSPTADPDQGPPEDLGSSGDMAVQDDMGGSCTDATDCDDGIPCTTDACTSSGCLNEADSSMCDDGNDCTVGMCEVGTGCTQSSAMDGINCTDTVGAAGTCSSGVCVSGCVLDSDCSDGIGCTTDSCNNGACEAPSPDNAACDDGNDCTANVCTLTGCSSTLVMDGTACTDAAGSAGTCNSGVCGTGCQNNGDCDDGIPCTDDLCDTGTGACTNLPNNGMCSDGVDCTTDACNPTVGCEFTPVNSACDDLVGCTVDVCDATTGCSNTTMDSLCNDSIGCTADTCSPTADCQFAPNAGDCDDSNPCTADACDQGSGTGCSNTNVADDTPCTNGAGNAGLCQTGSCTVECTQNSDCDDSNVCNGVETCNTGNGTCQAGSALNCADSFGCTTDSCDPTNGCEYTTDDSACNDGVGCTADSCSVASGCTNAPDASMCEDNNPCTADACDQGSGTGCSNTNVADDTPCMNGAGNAGLCQMGTCEVGCTQNSDCDNGNACDGVETCNTGNGTCQPGSAPNCNDGVGCTDDSCAPATGCVNTANDGNCDDGNPCTSGSCDMTGDCSQTNVADTTACMVGMGSGQCQMGTCIIGCTQNSDCNDGATCTNDVCDLMTGTCSNPVVGGSCNDGVGCTDDSCAPGAMGADGTTGCVNATNNGSCDDGNVCTVNSCDAGSDCQTSNVMNGVPCMAMGNAGLCQSGMCDVQCTQNSDCDDSNACNGVETCNTSNGQCQTGTAPNCNDGVGCTADSCNPASGCVNTPNDGMCGDGVGCTDDVCDAMAGCQNTPNNGSCDDSNPCTVNSCDAMSDCQTSNVMNGVPCMAMGNAGLCQMGMCDVQCTQNSDCDDSNACNGVETCNTSNGQCQGGSAPNCNDGVACTVDTCDMAMGCVNTPNDGMCGDGVGCTDDVCNPGTGCANTANDANCMDDSNECTAPFCDPMGDCSFSNVMDGTMCTGGSCVSGMCSTGNPRVYRLNNLSLEDPHAIVDTAVSVSIFTIDVCGDNTNMPFSPGFGVEVPALNPALAELIGMDGDDADSFLDLSFVLDFDDLNQSNGSTGTMNLVQSDCTTTTSCVPTPLPAGQRQAFSYEVRRASNCIPSRVTSEADMTQWPDGLTSSAEVNTPLQGSNGCFITTTANANFTLTVELSGTQVDIPLTDVVLAGQFTGEPATALTDGVLVGFLSEADADAIDITLNDIPIVGSITVNLGQDVLPEAGQCEGHDGRDMNGTTRGWWFMVDAAGGEVTMASGYDGI